MRIPLKARVVFKSPAIRKFTKEIKSRKIKGREFGPVALASKVHTYTYGLRTEDGRYLTWPAWTQRNDLEVGDVVEGSVAIREQDPYFHNVIVKNPRISKVVKLSSQLEESLSASKTKKEKDFLLEELTHLNEKPPHVRCEKSSHPADLALAAIERMQR